MEWTNEVIMEFLDLYEHEPIIWNPIKEDRKDRNKVYEAWKRIQTRFTIECSMKDLKKKKDNLMSTYRKLCMKVKKAGNTGRATKEVYKPEWFAYDKMDSFLHTVYAPRGTKATAVKVPCNTRDIDDDEEMSNGEETASNVKEKAKSSTASNTNESEGLASPAVTKGGPSLSKKRKSEQVAHIEKRMDDAYHFLKQVADKPKATKDETVLFCDLLCVKLQALDDVTREIAMHEINNLMFSYRKSRVQTGHVASNNYSYQYQYPHHRTGNSSQDTSPTPTPSP